MRFLKYAGMPDYNFIQADSNGICVPTQLGKKKKKTQSSISQLCPTYSSQQITAKLTTI